MAGSGKEMFSLKQFSSSSLFLARLQWHLWTFLPGLFSWQKVALCSYLTLCRSKGSSRSLSWFWISFPPVSVQEGLMWYRTASLKTVLALLAGNNPRSLSPVDCCWTWPLTNMRVEEISGFIMSFFSFCAGKAANKGWGEAAALPWKGAECFCGVVAGRWAAARASLAGLGAKSKQE